MSHENLSFGVWMELWFHSQAEGDPEAFYHELNDAYIAKDRYYHSAGHINNGWRELKLVRPKPRRPLQLGFANAGHDFIQNRNGKGTDEIDSASFMYRRLREAKMPRKFRWDVSGLIIVTDHKTSPKNYDEMVMADLDLLIFGKPEDEFDQYDGPDIRNEYIEVPDEIFYPARLSMIQQFLDRERIYYTDYFGEKYEVPAQKNLKRSKERLLSWYKSD